MTHQQINRREASYFGLAAIFVFINQMMLLIVQDRPVSDFWGVAVWSVCIVGLHLALKQALPYRDPVLAPSAMLLVGWGLTAIDRLAPEFADRQAIWILVGTSAMIGIVYLPHHFEWLRNWHWQWLLLGIAGLVATLLVGVNPTGIGPRLWLGSGELFYQPSEFLKIVLLIFLAEHLSLHADVLRQDIFNTPLITPTALVLTACVLILVLQRDLGAAAILFVVYIMLLYVVSGNWVVLAGAGVLILIASVAAYLAYDLVQLRVDVWINPWPESNDRAYQIVQSLMAISAGSLLGSGVGQGLPTFIPVVHSDFIFAAIAEEWGLLGVLGLLFMFVVLVLRGLQIATVAIDHVGSFEALLAAGISALIAVQSLIIMGGTLRLWPLTGVTLPWMSYGGSSLLSMCIALGLLLIISHRVAPR